MFFGLGHPGRQMLGMSAKSKLMNSASLSLDFMTPGVLDPRITFTRASTATFFDSAGMMQTAATNAPRWDYDPSTLQLKGLLLEEARTNSTLQSGNLGIAPWTPAAITVALPVVTSNQVVAPDGTMSGARIVYPEVIGAGTVSYVRQPITPAAAVYAFSMYLRGAIGGEQLYIMCVDGGQQYNRQAVTLTTSWQRYVMVTNTLLNTSINFGVGVDLRDAGQTTKPAQTIYAWGVQLEQGTFPTSYIPTTGSAVTRSADACSVQSADMSPWFAPPGGTWFAEFTQNVVRTISNTSPRVIGIRNATAITPLWVTGATNVLATYDGSQAQVGNSIIAGAISRSASNWAPSNGRVCLNGGAIGAAGTMVTGFGTLATAGISILGGNPGTVNETMNGYARRVVYWSRVLTDAEMQSITA